MSNSSGGKTSRRSFLTKLGASAGSLMMANVGVYVIGSAFKNLDGSLVAGAKCQPPGTVSFSAGGPSDDTLCTDYGWPGTYANAWCCSGTESTTYGFSDTVGGTGGCYKVCN